MSAAVAGRDLELADLQTLVGEVLSGRACGAVIEGPAGLGKSTLLAAARAEAEARGLQSVSARAEELEQERTFGLVAALIRQLRPRRSQQVALDDLLASGAESNGAFRVIDAVTELLEARVVRTPLLICLDDVQWSDEWSLRTVAIAFRRLRELPLGVLVGARPSPRGPELRSLMAALLEKGVHLPLAPLNEDGVAELVRLRSGAEPDGRLRETLRRAGGNPFFVSELYDALERDGMLESGAGSTGVTEAALPQGLLLTVLHRMRALPAGDLDLVRAAAVLARGFTVRHLAIATARPEAELLASVLRLREEGILTEEGDRFKFRHDLMREAVYEDLGGPVRGALHARIGHAIADAGLDIEEAGHHLLLGAVRGDALAIERMLAASNSPRVTLREAAALLRRVLDLDPGHSDAIEIKRRLASLLHASDRPAEAIPLLESVLTTQSDPADRLDTVSALAVAALRGTDAVAYRQWREEAALLAEQLAGSDDPRVLLDVALCHFDRDDLETAQAIAGRAIPLADSTGDPRDAEEPHSTRGWLLSAIGRPREALEHCQRAVELSRGHRSEGMRLIHLSVARRRLWEMDAAGEALVEARAVADARGVHSVSLKATCETAWLDYLAGRWEEAALQADTALEMMREFGITSDVPHPALVRGWLSLNSGDVEGAQAWRDAALSAERETVWLTVGLQRAQGDLAQSAATAATLVRRLTRYPNTRLVEILLPDVARVALAVGDDATAKEALQISMAYAEGADSAPSVELAALRCRSLVERDEEAAMKAVTIGAASPWPLERNGTFEDAAVALSDRKEELLGRAFEGYEAAGLTIDARRVAMARVGAPSVTHRPVRPVTGWEALTDAERKVVDLAAEGLTNREIAGRLFISHRTVGTHLAHVFDKLQVRSRVELARLAASRQTDR